MLVDIVTDLSRGDSAKGKVVHYLLKQHHYDAVFKTSGSHNAGHTIYHDGQKFITHLIPAGVFFGKTSIIGRNCLVHPQSFLNELNHLQEQFKKTPSLTNINLHQLVKIDQNAFIITDEHIAEDSKDEKIGTTKKGTGPAARDKYARLSQQVKDIEELRPYLFDFSYKSGIDNWQILCEGAQGFYLDIHFGDYPYVTSSHCTTAAAILCGIPHSAINKVYGVCKAYETYVGAKKFEGDDPIFAQMREVGQEFGSTTGRPRQCNFLNLDELLQAYYASGVDMLIVNKMDVLRKLDCWKVINHGEVIDLSNEDAFKKAISDKVNSSQVKFSYSAEYI